MTFKKISTPYFKKIVYFFRNNDSLVSTPQLTGYDVKIIWDEQQVQKQHKKVKKRAEKVQNVQKKAIKCTKMVQNVQKEHKIYKKLSNAQNVQKWFTRDENLILIPRIQVF